MLDEDTVATALRDIGSHEVTLSDDDTGTVVLLHDPSDIRKPYSTKLECLGTVRALNGQLIPGYQTFNTVVLDEHGSTPQPMDVSVYSNGDPQYVTEKELTLYHRLQQPDSPSSAAKTLCADRIEEIRQFLADDSYVNLYRVVSAQLTRVSQSMQAQYPERDRCHVLDRQFDGVRYAKLIDQQLHDSFVLRLKGSRTIPGWTWSGQPGTVNVRDVPCRHVAHYVISKVRLRHKTYQNVTCYLEWEPFCIEDLTCTMVRVTLCRHRGRPIFDEPMVLLTNLPVTCREQARRVYTLYLLRAKIEGVFKFCKMMLGWEEPQVRDYASMKALLALAMYVAGYFYASDSELIENPVIELICLLGGGKGTVTRHFLLKGLQKLLIYRSVLHFKRTLQHASQEDCNFDDLMAFIE